jgi:hypothetical protein
MKNTAKKGCILLVIVLLCCLSCIPSITSSVISPSATVPIEVNQYQPDGSINTATIYLAEDDIAALRADILAVGSAGERFAVYQYYGLIPEGVSLATLQQDMMYRAGAMEFSPERSQLKNGDALVKNRLPILFDLFCRVSTIHSGGCSARIGLSPLVSMLNFYKGWNLPKADVMDVTWGTVGVVDTWGLLTHHSLVSFPGMMCLVGFVGYNFKMPFLAHIFDGYAAATFAMGFGLHAVIFFYWLQGQNS